MGCLTTFNGLTQRQDARGNLCAEQCTDGELIDPSSFQTKNISDDAQLRSMSQIHRFMAKKQVSIHASIRTQPLFTIVMVAPAVH